MKRAVLFFIGGVLSLSCLSTSLSVSAQQPQESTAILYSTIKYKDRGDRRACLNFQTSSPISLTSPCDMRYGSLQVNDDLDWFASSAAGSNRSVIKDLGALSWTANINVPVLEPFPKLKPGEQRVITIEANGADGADGVDGEPGAAGETINDATGARSGPMIVTPRSGPRSGRPPRPKHDGKPKIDPIFAKAIVGHLYVIHVVDDTRDFYALFRVEALDRGASCTISWKLIPEPPKPIK